ncbi:FecR domain-containing protein [Draconibacterium sp. IB214405]|uniref:FecR family protein n=1 Tax=Draconibacterium sp. IB214405 TaxID=3097352 RepID=UPI002A0CFF73|nr:FecR domain-containing protein [Draconibacterium sp. IB214405]MDX8339397.1 FecR domain-containing protein [Draconibacterium sp. IB214405]
MNLYHQLIENPLFFKWIYHNSPEINDYWEHFLREHPEDAAVIREFKAGFEQHLQYDEHQLSEKEKKDLAIRILKKIEQVDNKKKYIKVIRLTMRYAAIAILFLMVGSAVTWYFLEDTISNRYASFPAPQNLNIQEPTLIIDDQQEVALNKGKSELEYSDEGKIIIDKKQVIEDDVANEVKMNTLVIPYGNHSTITLSDGTKVWLNAGSRLIYPSRFLDKNREVMLLGEAFFEVSKMEDKPFTVKTPDIEVHVLGTKFNVSAYPDENVAHTVLTEGSVEISHKSQGVFDRNIVLIPGQLAAYNKQNSSTNIYDVETEYFTSWKEGYLTFTNSDLNRVVKKLERYYNIHMRYDDPLDGSLRISGKLDISKDQDVVFEYMNSLTGLNFEKINERNYLIK